MPELRLSADLNAAAKVKYWVALFFLSVGRMSGEWAIGVGDFHRKDLMKIGVDDRNIVD